MARSKLFALARTLTLAASVGAPSLALAADLLPPPPPPPYAPPVEVGGGWYLRGDVGASVYERPHFSVPQEQLHYFGETASGGFFAGVGVGYQFNNWFRADVTGEYRSTGLRLNSYSDYAYSCGDAYTSCNATGRNYNSTNGNYSAAVVLANAYFDLGNWYGVTPFVGAGIGTAISTTTGWVDSGISKTTLYYPDYDYTTTTGGASAGAFKDKSKTSLAWALHAGLAYDVTPNFKVELAYRYLNLGTASTGVLNCFCGETLSAVKIKDLESHDIKIGLRYLLGGGIVAPVPAFVPEYQPAPGPLVRKY